MVTKKAERPTVMFSNYMAQQHSQMKKAQYSERRPNSLKDFFTMAQSLNLQTTTMAKMAVTAAWSTRWGLQRCSRFTAFWSPEGTGDLGFRCATAFRYGAVRLGLWRSEQTRAAAPTSGGDENSGGGSSGRQFLEVPNYEHDDAKAIEKDNALHWALSRLSSEFDRESIVSLQRFFGIRRVPVIPTGSLKLDLALGIGGLPRGRFVEIFGHEASGKTTLALHIIKEAQKLGGVCAYFDVENAMDPSLAESMGIDAQNLLISSPNSAENLLSAVDTLTKSGSVDVIVVDSVAALVPQCELDVSIDGVWEDVQSRIMSQALRKIHYSLCNSQTLIVFVNQVRSSPKSRQGFGYVGENTCGGNALKFYAAVRLKIGKTGLLKIGNEVTGLGISVQVVKNKLAPAMKKAELRLHFGRGFCCESEVLELACEHGVIVKDGNRYLIEGKFFSNEQAAKHYLVENEIIFDKIVDMLRKLLFETS